MALTSEELLTEAKEFFETYKSEIGKYAKEGKKSVQISFQDIASHSHQLAESLILQPEETIQLLELAVEENGLINNARARLLDLPQTEMVAIRNLRAKHINHLICVEGLIRMATDVRPKIVNAKFECPNCGTILSILQLDEKFTEPNRCSCGRKGGFKLLSKDMVDAQKITVEESPDSVPGSQQPRRINVYLKEDLVEPVMEEKTTPGSKVKVIGILKEVPIPHRTGGIHTRFDLVIDANNIIPMEETFDELNITEEDERQIQELAADPQLYMRLRESIAPSIFGYEEIKEALALQLFSGWRRQRNDGTFSRGDIHILLVGDPGVAKSVMLKFISMISPKGRYISGKSVTGAGLTATVIKDEFLRGWCLEAGTMVLAHKGLCAIDELEDMDEDDRSSMHEAMEQQCMLPDFKLMLSNGKYVKIGNYIDSLMANNKNAVIKGKDCEILEINNAEILSTDFSNIFPIKTSRVSRHIAPKSFIKIELSNGREITVTPEHPCWVVKNGKIITVPAEKLTNKDYFSVPSSIEIKEKEYKKENDILCKILGYHISDGCYELNRGKKTGIQFWNNDIDLIEDYKQSIEKFFGIKTIITKRKNQFAVRAISKKIIEYITNLDPTLLEKGIIKKIPAEIMSLPKENIKYLLRALFDGDGTVVLEKRNSCRVSLSAENLEVTEQVSDLLLRFGITSSIFKDKNIWKIDISGQENLSKYLTNISFLSKHKKQRLKNYCSINKTYRTIKDIIPNCTNKINEIFKKLKISARKEIGHSIDLGVEKQRLFLQKLILIAEGYAIEKDNKELLNEIKEIKKLAFGVSRWIKIKRISRIKNDNVRWVYDVTVEPYHTFISNGMILHNTITINKANVHACYSEDTEVLTETGWKKYSEVKEEKIAQYNPKDRTIQFLPHKGLYAYDYNSKMYHYKNGKNDILVTPNHKMLAREFSQKNLMAIEAQNLDYNYIKFVNSGDYIGKEKKDFILPAIKHKQNRKHPKYVHQHIDKKISMDLWLEFLGYYLTEGGIETAPTIGIVQRKGENAEKIKRCLTKLTSIIGCSLSEIDCKKYIRYKITQTQLYEYLKNFGEKCYFKKSNLNFSLLSKRQLKILFEALMLGDGSSDKKCFSVTSKELSDELQIIAHLIGKSASQHIHYLEGSRKNRKTMFRVSISNETEPSIRKKDIKIIDYTGKVFCFSTETGFFITRRNGKIAIQGNTLRAETSVLAAANPKFGRFDSYRMITEQINIDPALLNRFDLIFIMKDIPERSKDEAIATHVLMERQHPFISKKSIDPLLLKKYIAYSKQKVFPELTDQAIDEIKKFYVDLRNMPTVSENLVKPIPITARQLEALIRVSEAHARARLSKKVTKEDAKRAIELQKYCLMQVGFDEETQQIDIDKISTGVTASQKSKIIIVKEAIIRLESRLGKMIPIEEIAKELGEKIDQESVEEIIEKLAIAGDVFKPKRGFIQRM